MAGGIFIELGNMERQYKKLKLARDREGVVGEAVGKPGYYPGRRLSWKPQWGQGRKCSTSRDDQQHQLLTRAFY